VLDTFDDRVFMSSINKAIKETDKFFERMNFREALKSGFFDLQAARDNYRVAVGSQNNMNKQLIHRFIEVQAVLLAPICPHFSQYSWQLLGKAGVIQKASWPDAGPVDEVVLKQNEYLQGTVHNFRLRKEAYLKPKKPKKGEAPQSISPPTKAVISVVKSYPQWMQNTLAVLRPFFITLKPGQIPDKKEIQVALNSNVDLKPLMKEVMPFAEAVKEEFQIIGMSALDLKMIFDEKSFLEDSIEFIKKSIGILDVTVNYMKEDEITNNKPGKPLISFSS